MSDLDVPEGSTFGSVNQILQTSTEWKDRNLTLLVQSYGPWPCWRFPSSGEGIPSKPTTLFLVDNSKSFMIALLRTETEDQPLIIGDIIITTLGRRFDEPQSYRKPSL
jgi:hypothetical protein